MFFERFFYVTAVAVKWFLFNLLFLNFKRKNTLMITVIISSAQQPLLNDVIVNIKNTIGVEHEIITFENSEGLKGICELYNIGAKRAKYDILCYMHEDISIKTQDWGLEVISVFKQSDVGVLGVVGSSYKSEVPSGWFAEGGEVKLISCNYIQSFKRKERKSVHHYLKPDDGELSTVVCVDGMWFCTPKSLALENPFDEQLLRGFHGYDIDYCLQINLKYRVVVSFNILMEHFSEGGYNQSWLDDTLKLQEKWGFSLPRSTKDIPESDQLFIKKRAYKELLERFVGMRWSLGQIISFLYQFKKAGKLDTGDFCKLVFYASKYTLKKSYRYA